MPRAAQFLSLPPVEYAITAAHAGFDGAKLTDITLNVYQALTLDIGLKNGHVAA